jgi:hypothetical protein
VNILGFGMFSDSRYGVFKICIYDLIKRDLVMESDGDLNLTLHLAGAQVYIGTGKQKLYLMSSSAHEIEED